MNATFLVTIDLPDTSAPTLQATANDMQDDLEGSFSVISVKPWQRDEMEVDPYAAQPPLPGF